MKKQRLSEIKSDLRGIQYHWIGNSKRNRELKDKLLTGFIEPSSDNPPIIKNILAFTWEWGQHTGCRRGIDSCGLICSCFCTFQKSPNQTSWNEQGHILGDSPKGPHSFMFDELLQLWKGVPHPWHCDVWGQPGPMGSTTFQKQPAPPSPQTSAYSPSGAETKARKK